MQDLFKFVKENSECMQAYEMEQNILQSVLKLGYTAMQYYFAEKGTGDVESSCGHTVKERMEGTGRR